MRIVHVTSMLSRRSAGVRTAVESLARAQQEMGHEVVVVGLGDADYHANDHIDLAGLDVRPCRITGPEALGWSSEMACVIRAAKPDVMHLHGLWQGIAQSVVSVNQRTNIPFILSVHGMLGAVPLTYSPNKKRIARFLFQDKAFTQAACLHATSPSEAEEIRAYGLRSPITLVPNGVSELFVPRLLQPSEPPYKILSLGRIHPKKGLDVLINAWSRLEVDFPEWELCLVGPDENGHARELSEQITRLGLQRCHLKGPKFGKDRDCLMAEAAIFALPTRSENFALTVGESLMLEVPVVASKGAPWQRLEHEGCGLWVDMGAVSFANALRQLMVLPPEIRRDMGRRGRAWMLRDFAWSAVAQKFTDTYRWALGSVSIPDNVERYT